MQRPVRGNRKTGDGKAKYQAVHIVRIKKDKAQKNGWPRRIGAEAAITSVTQFEREQRTAKFRLLSLRSGQ
jgi:hypothetical protein